MDPLFEQRLRDEVIYLHSLWHQGPPTPHHLLPSQTTQFKKHKKPKPENRNSAASESNSEWPCPAPPPSTTGWPCLQEPQPNPPLSAEQEWNLAGIHAQKKALSVVHEFLTSNNSDDSDADVDSSSDDEDDELMEKDEHSRSFFSNVFTEDTKLRDYYEKSFANGEFSCLVCGALGGKRTLKKFKGCLPLLQHSIAISSNKRAHRAFGEAACKVLGWDLDILPAIVSMLSEGKCSSDNDKDSSSMPLVNNFASVKNNDKNDDAADEGDTNAGGAVKNLEDCTEVQILASDGLTISSLTSPETDNNLENLGMVYRHNVEEHASQGLKIGNSSGDNEEGSSVAPVDNFDSVNNDTCEGKIDEAAPESLCMGSGIPLHGDEGDMNSVTCPNAGKNLEDRGVVHTQNMEERALDELPINSLTFPDAGGNIENLSRAYEHEVEEPGHAS